MALVVETGAGDPTAESYLSVAGADAYHAAHGDPAAWSGATTGTKEAALRAATQYVDDKYAKRWKGQRKTLEQALRWPRYQVYVETFLLDNTTIPQKLKDAVAVAALAHVNGAPLFVTESSTQALTSESIQVGQLSISESYAGAKSAQPSIPQVPALLADLIEPPGALER